MFRKMLVGVVMMAGASIAFADAKEDVQAAAKKLSGESYTFKSTTQGGQGGGTREGKVQKDGLIMMNLTFRDNTIQIIKNGEKGAIKTEDGWKSFAEAGQDDQQGPGRFIARMAAGIQAPAAQAQEIVGKLKELQKSDDAYTATLSEEGAKELMAFGRRRGGNNNGPQINNAKGSVKFWVKDGVLTKMEQTVSGTMTINNEDRDINRTTTTEITNVGSTTVEIPTDAKAKLQ